MLVVIGTIDLEPADREAYLESKRPRVLETRREPGCLDYAFSADAADPGRVRLIERWADRPSFDAHVALVLATPPDPTATTVPVIDATYLRYRVEPLD